MLNTDEFRKALQANIDKYNNRPAPPQGHHYLRTPYDTIKERGELTVEALPSLYMTIVEKHSTLPSSQRSAIVGIVNDALFATHQALQEKELPEDVRAKRAKAAGEQAAKQLAAGVTPPADVIAPKRKRTRKKDSE